MRVRPGAYLVLFFCCAATAFAAGWVGWWSAGVLHCPPPPAGTFLAYCRDEAYGDFEHGAFLFGLEAKAVQQARLADVVVIGNSRAQFGFSTEAMRRHFARRGWSYYLLAMGYGSTSAYAEELLKRYAIRPRVLVVNADPFFTADAPSVVADVLAPDRSTLWSYRRKWVFQRLLRSTCQPLARWCGDVVGGIHRRIDTGEWIWNGVLVSGDLSVPFAERIVSPRQEAESARLATSFVRGLGLPARCVIVTEVPGLSADARRAAATIAAAAGARAILPVTDGLASLDGDHLNAASAERWVEAFLAAADATFADCLGG